MNFAPGNESVFAFTTPSISFITEFSWWTSSFVYNNKFRDSVLILPAGLVYEPGEIGDWTHLTLHDQRPAL